MLESFPRKWILAGGWALDTFLGKQTRPHDDIDVLITREDQLDLQKYLHGWDLQAGDPPGTLRPWKSGELLREGIHDIWARPDNSSPWKIQFMLFESADGEWIYRRNKAIRGPLDSFSLKSHDGFSYLAPEIQLLYKSAGLREKDRLDFENVAPHLDADKKAWLKQALVIANGSDHEWVSLL